MPMLVISLTSNLSTKYQSRLRSNLLGHLHIVAHSMGNRVLTDGLLSPTINEKERTRLGQIIFAAADVNRKTFHKQYDLEKIKAMSDTLCFQSRRSASGVEDVQWLRSPGRSESRH
jgi:esterase/lipase superfamily enzyme